MKTRLRLSFEIDTDCRLSCQGYFDRRLRPLLEQAGAEQITIDECPMREDVFAVLFTVASPAAVPIHQKTLEESTGWQAAMKRLSDLDFMAKAADTWLLEVYDVENPMGTSVEAGEGGRQGLWHNMSVRDGLPSAMIRGIMQDRHNNLWLYAYKGGVCRFNGRTFHEYTVDDGLPDDTVHHVIEAPDGHLWFATRKGLVRYDGTTLRVFSRTDGMPYDTSGPFPEHISWDSASPLWAKARDHLWCPTPRGLARFDGTKFDTFTEKDGLPDNTVTRLLEDSTGSIWCATPQGLARFRGDRFDTFTEKDGLPDNMVIRLLEDSEGSVWCATLRGLTRFRGDKFDTFTEMDGLPDQPLVPILETSRSVVWFSTIDYETESCALVTFDKNKFKSFARRPGMPWVSPLVAGIEDRQGVLWFGTAGDGILRSDGEQFVHITTEDGLSHNEPYSLVEDRQGNIWVGTWGGGLGRYLGTYCRSYTTQDGLGHDAVESVLEDRDGLIWFAHRIAGGASSFDGRTFKMTSALDGLGANRLWTIYQDQRGHMWFGTISGGVTRYDGRTYTTFTKSDGLPDDSIMSICEDRDGHMWFATQEGGVARFDGRTFTVFSKENGLPDNMVWFVHQDHGGDMWFGTWESGVTRYDGRTFKTFTTADGLVANTVWCVFEDRHHNLWIGAYGGGLSRFDGTQFTNFTAQDGLPDENIRSVYEDREGRIWMATYGGGVVLFDGAVFQRIDYNSGLVHNAAQDILQDRDGAMWFATEGGVTRYTPLRVPPCVDLIDVVADKHNGAVDELTVSVSQQIILFMFRGRSFTTTPGQFAYRYRLKGYDGEWRTAYEAEVEYRELPLGDYIFEVRAVDRDLNYSSTASVNLHVVPDQRQDRIQALEAELFQTEGLGQFVGQSPALKAVLEQIHVLANTEVTGLILGETGTGKGMAARAIHALSPRKDQPYIHINCGAIPEGLVESELFGHEKGAFTGAVTRKMGRFELADGGTLFLDEIGDLPRASQQVLLHVLQDGIFQRVGGRQDIKADVRILAATNRDLNQDMLAGTFREDLYYRLNTFILNMPPLRARHEDIPLLVEYFVEHFSRHLNRATPVVDADALWRLQRYDWPGNVRELEHLIQRGILVCKEQVIRSEDFSMIAPTNASPSGDHPPSLKEHQAQSDGREKQLIEQALAASDGRVYGDRGAARLLDVSPEALRVKIRKYGLKS